MTHRIASRACRLVQDRMTAQLRRSVEARPCSRYFEHDAIASSIAASAFRRQPIGEAMRMRFEALSAFERGHVAALATSYAIARLRAFPFSGNGARDGIGDASTGAPRCLPLSEIGAANAALSDEAGASPAPRSGAPADLSEEIAA